MPEWLVFIAGILLGAAAAGLAAAGARRRKDRAEEARLSRLAHDLRTPLASITAYAELLADAEEGGGLDRADRARFLGIVNGESRRLGDLIDARLAPSNGARRVEGAPAPAGPEAPGPPAPAPHRTILVVDDDRFIVEATRTLLAREGFEALGAAGGEEALARARDARPDLILMDLSMPGMSGDQALRRLRSDPATRDIPVIITTGDSHGAPPEGAAALLTKPVTRETLLAAIGRVAPAPVFHSSRRNED